MYLCVSFGCENKQQALSIQHQLTGFYNWDGVFTVQYGQFTVQYGQYRSMDSTAVRTLPQYGQYRTVTFVLQELTEGMATFSAPVYPASCLMCTASYLLLTSSLPLQSPMAQSLNTYVYTYIKLAEFSK